MPVEKNQKLTLLNYPEAGIETNLDPSVEIKGETELIITCESSTCGNKISWIIEKAGESIDALPDDAYRILILEEFGGTKHVYCSYDCLRRAMKSYVPPLSPREKMIIEENNKKIEAENTTATVNAVGGQAAVSQPDGFAEENS